MKPSPPNRYPALSLVVSLFALAYFLGAIYLLSGWAGLVSFPPGLIADERMVPLYGLLCLAGSLSAVAVAQRKRWGVYGLVVTWGAMGGLNLLFSPSQEQTLSAPFAATLLIIAFFLLLLPAWRDMR